MRSLLDATTRRSALVALGQSALVLSVAGTLGDSARAEPATAEPQGAKQLSELRRTLSGFKRRRGFPSVPFILNDERYWDREAAEVLLSYNYPHRQMWENTELAGQCVNLMREATNGQVFSHGNKDFLAISATHGSAHLALFNQQAWEKYGLAEKTDGKFASNSFIIERPGTSPHDDIQDLDGFYGPSNNNIISLQRRGMVFVGCHDSIHAIARGLRSSPALSSIPADEIAADLTNSLIPDVILVPSVVAFIAELQRSGYSYAKGT
ncbi:transcriptional initiation protein Tat [Rhizobium sp. BK251]|uniref:thiosulfate dehydrogenase n=1 Tax=Rhizobium sp. BK251 TaxID=2512125 RepID=UPI00104BABF1|nr:transcriptional initiation protein Tat [Rhizobium sp. BK251]TCL67179.1 hypothetical protein EV286_11080 [Rhizobium sp. BK251]